MNEPPVISKTERHLKRYYRWNSHLYDATRWAILWGRKWLSDYLRIELEELSKNNPGAPSTPSSAPCIVEIGCGTGYHLSALTPVFKNSVFYGFDASAHMLNKAYKKIQKLKNVQLHEEYFSSNSLEYSSVDCFICSYSMSMNKNIPSLIESIHLNMKDSGVLYIVDFLSTSSDWFYRWMMLHGVYIHSEIISELQKTFKLVEYESKSGFFGLYRYGVVKAIK
jgi:S-adenosylmethionine-diacylgycerolhomoserine-N-methlytransferase